MKTKLLKKIRRNWSIKEHNDGEYHLYRAFYKGERVPGAHVHIKWHENALELLVHQIAVCEFTRTNRNIFFNGYFYENFTKKRKEALTRKKQRLLFEKIPNVWPLSDKEVNEG